MGANCFLNVRFRRNSGKRNALGSSNLFQLINRSFQIVRSCRSCRGLISNSITVGVDTGPSLLLNFAVNHLQLILLGKLSSNRSTLCCDQRMLLRVFILNEDTLNRSEERRVGKESSYQTVTDDDD